jgi:hypothetical protein
MSEAIFLYSGQEVVEGVPVASDLGPRREGGQPFLKERQVAQDRAVRALDGGRELERDVLGRPLSDVLDDEVHVGQVRVVF